MEMDCLGTAIARSVNEGLIGVRGVRSDGQVRQLLSTNS